MYFIYTINAIQLFDKDFSNSFSTMRIYLIKRIAKSSDNPTLDI